MRYADGPTAEVEIFVAAPAARVWPLVTDIDLPSRFSTEFLGGRWIDEGPALDARFAGRNRHKVRGEWETTCVVTACDVNECFAWAVGDATTPMASWRFTIEPAPGGVRLRQWVRIGPAPSGLTPAILAMPDKEERIVERRLEELRTNMQATVEGIKQLAESESEPTS